MFSGTPADGHGQHQVSGIIARQAFDVMRDSAGGPVKFYRSTRGDTSATTLSFSVGQLDPVLGQSYLQIAMASRSRHRSQDMGALQRMGPATARVALVAGRAGTSSESGLFAGVDTAFHIDGYSATIDSARAALTPWRHPRRSYSCARTASAPPMPSSGRCSSAPSPGPPAGDRRHRGRRHRHAG